MKKFLIRIPVMVVSHDEEGKPAGMSTQTVELRADVPDHLTEVTVAEAFGTQLASCIGFCMALLAPPRPQPQPEAAPEGVESTHPADPPANGGAE